MKKLAARDFEDLLQVCACCFKFPYLGCLTCLKCSLPAFEGLLDEPHDTRLMKLLYHTAEWHALAKLRMHTDGTLELLEHLTTDFGKLMRQFRDLSCPEFATVELPREANARRQRQLRELATQAQAHPLEATSGTNENNALPPISQPPTHPTPLSTAVVTSVEEVETSSGITELPPAQPLANASSSRPSAGSRKPRTLNIFTVKFHFLGDYVRHIRLFGTTDSYSTQLVCLSRLYIYTQSIGH